MLDEYTKGMPKVGSVARVLSVARVSRVEMAISMSPFGGGWGGVVLFILLVLVEGYFNFNIQLRIENYELIPMNEFMG